MATTKVHRISEPSDFRPPWFYALARVLSWTLIPYAALYGTFIYDFGNRDHVFQPARTWLERQKAAFFTLSPDEQRIVEAQPTSAPKEP